MKKLLLSMLAAVASFTVASATEVAFDFQNPGDDGTYYGYTPHSSSVGSSTYEADGSTITDGGVTLTFAKNGKNGWRFWSTGTYVQLRLMNAATMTVSVPSGCTISSIDITGYNLTNMGPTENGTTTKFTSGSAGSWSGSAESVVFTASGTSQLYTMTVVYESNDKTIADASFAETNLSAVLGDSFSAPKFTTTSDGEVTYSSSDEAVATVDASTGAVTLVGYGSTTIKAAVAETDTYNATAASYTLNVIGAEVSAALCGSTMSAGKYFMAFEDVVAIPVVENTKSFGYLYGATASFTSSSVTSTEDNLFEFEASGEYYTIKDSHGRYLYCNGTYTSFQLGTENTGTDYFLWSVTLDSEGVATITNKGNGFIVWWNSSYSNFCPGNGVTENYPTMYKVEEDNSAIENIASDSEEGEAVYYNLQGERVSNPSNGIFIRVINNKAQKVML